MKKIVIGSFVLLLLNFWLARPAFAGTAVAALKGTQEGSAVTGNVQFEEIPAGLKVSATVSGAKPGPHGFHIHENGSCDNAGAAAGGHFNPDQVSHGLLAKNGFSKAHAGDLGNIEIAEDGTGKLEALIPGLTLTDGKYAVNGKAVILHEKADDFGQPTGNAGSRVGCGIITSETK